MDQNAAFTLLLTIDDVMRLTGYKRWGGRPPCGINVP